jgi:hypothetical protein
LLPLILYPDMKNYEMSTAVFNVLNAPNLQSLYKPFHKGRY